MARVLWDGQEPDLYKCISKAFKKGWLVTHALPLTTHTESLEFEELVRGMIFSSELSKAAGDALKDIMKKTIQN